MSADRIAWVRENLDILGGPESSTGFLLEQHDALAAEVKRYRDAFAGLYIARDAYEHPTLWLQQGDGQPQSMGCLCNLAVPFWDALVAVIPEHES